MLNETVTIAPTDITPDGPTPAPAEAAMPEPDPEQFRITLIGLLARLCHPAATRRFDPEAHVFEPIRRRVAMELTASAAVARYRRLRAEQARAAAEQGAIDSQLAERRSLLHAGEADPAADELISLETELAPLEARRTAIGKALKTLDGLLREARGQAEAELHQLATAAEIAATQDLTARRQAILDGVIGVIEDYLIDAACLGMSLTSLAAANNGVEARLMPLLDATEDAHA